MRTDESEAVSTCKHLLAILEALQRSISSLSKDLLVPVKISGGNKALAFAIYVRCHREALRHIAATTRALYRLEKL